MEEVEPLQANGRTRSSSESFGVATNRIELPCAEKEADPILTKRHSIEYRTGDKDVDSAAVEPFIQSPESNPNSNISIDRIRILNTVSLYCSYALFGFCVTLLGPALQDLKVLLGTTTKDIVLVFTFQSGGFILGSFGVMPLIGRINYNVIVLLCGVGVLISVAVMPWMPSLASFIAVGTLQGVMSSALHTTAQVYLVVLWENSSYSHSLMQGMHGVWSIAATIGPFILSPFLSQTSAATELQGNITCNSTDTVMFAQINGSNIVSYNGSASGSEDTTEEGFNSMVQYGFLTVVSICALAPMMNGIAFCCENKGLWFTHGKEKHTVEKSMKHSLSTRLLLIAVLAAYFSVYVSEEVATGNLAATFVLQGLKWERWTGPVITSVYWGSFGLARVVAIFIAMVVPAKRMVAVMVTVICAAFLAMTVAAESHEVVTWVCIALIGAGEGPFFASGMVMANKIISLDGVASALFTISSSAAIMVSNTVVGSLFDKYGHMTMIYYFFASSILLVVLFFVVAVLDSKFSLKHDEKKHVNETSTEC